MRARADDASRWLPTVARRGCGGTAGPLGRTTGQMQGECRCQGGERGLNPRRAQLSPRHACGLYRVLFLHHLHYATHRLGNALEVIRKRAVSLRNPAPKAVTLCVALEPQAGGQA